MNIFTAVKNLTFVAKLFAAAKLNLDEFVAAGDESALAAHITAVEQASSAKTTTGVTVDTNALEAALLTTAGITVKAGETSAAALAGHIAKLNTQISTAATRAQAVTASLTAAGVKVAADSTTEQFAAALEARISMRAGEEVAKLGMKSADLPKQEVNADATAAARKSKTEGLTGLARVTASLQAGQN